MSNIALAERDLCRQVICVSHVSFAPTWVASVKHSFSRACAGCGILLWVGKSTRAKMRRASPIPTVSSSSLKEAQALLRRCAGFTVFALLAVYLSQVAERIRTAIPGSNLAENREGSPPTAGMSLGRCPPTLSVPSPRLRSGQPVFTVSPSSLYSARLSSSRRSACSLSPLFTSRSPSPL